MTISAALEYFRAAEDPASLLLLNDDKDLTAILVAWSSAFIRQHSKKNTIANNDAHTQWQELWSLYSIDIEALAAATGLSSALLPPAIIKLVNARLLYPDGSISTYAKNFLRAQVAKTLKAIAPKQPKA